MSISQISNATETAVSGAKASYGTNHARGRAATAASLDERLVAVGVLAAGLAHEMATPLQFARDSLHLARELLTGRDGVEGEVEAHEPAGRETAQDLEAALGRALDGVERVALLARRLSRFVRSEGCDTAQSDVEATILDALALARNEYRYVASLETRLGTTSAVRCASADLLLLIISLVVAAAESLDAVSAAGASLGARRGRLVLKSRDDGPWVVIELERVSAVEGPTTHETVLHPATRALQLVERVGGHLSVVERDERTVVCTLTLPAVVSEGAQ